MEPQITQITQKDGGASQAQGDAPRAAAQRITPKPRRRLETFSAISIASAASALKGPTQIRTPGGATRPRSVRFVNPAYLSPTPANRCTGT